MGELVAGSMDATNAEAVGNELGRLGHFPVTIKSAEVEKEKGEKIDPLERFQKVKMKELVLFTRQMSTLFNAGIPVLGILVALEDQVETPKFRRVVKQVRADIEGGLSMSEAMEKHPDVFDELYSSMIEAGEAGGVMDELLKRLATLMERQVETDAKVKGALSYPKMVISAMLIAITVLMWKVVPIFVNMFEKAKIELPLATKILIVGNKAFFDYWYLLLGGDNPGHICLQEIHCHRKRTLPMGYVYDQGAHYGPHYIAFFNGQIRTRVQHIAGGRCIHS